VTQCFHIKDEIRILGIDDSALISDNVLIVGAFFRGKGWIDGVLSSYMKRDGMDGTESIIKMVRESKYFQQTRLIMLDGVTYAGFNPIDIEQIYYDCKIPVLVLMRKYPDMTRIEKALSYLPHGGERLDIIKKAGEIFRVKSNDALNPVYIQCKGISVEDAARIVRLTSTKSNIPEPLRVAHLIATGIILGESRGKA